MVDEADRLRRDPALRGVPNPVEPGEPDPDDLQVSDPVPNTGHKMKEAHKQEHASYANSPTKYGEGRHNPHEPR